MATYRRPFKAIRTMYNGISYASKAEARRAAELELLQRSGQVVWWIPQVTIRLGCPENTYRVDFLVAEQGGGLSEIQHGLTVHAEDVKGWETPQFAKQKRLWERYGPFPLHVIYKGCVEVVGPGEEQGEQT